MNLFISNNLTHLLSLWKSAERDIRTCATRMRWTKADKSHSYYRIMCRCWDQSKVLYWLIVTLNNRFSKTKFHFEPKWLFLYNMILTALGSIRRTRHMWYKRDVLGNSMRQMGLIRAWTSFQFSIKVNEILSVLNKSVTIKFLLAFLTFRFYNSEYDRKSTKSQTLGELAMP